MRPPHIRPSLRASIEATVPRIGGWDTFRGAAFNLLVFGIVAVAGDWLVHQLEYLIEYGNRFGAVMTATPHRFYMRPLGVTLGALFLAAVVLTCVALLGGFLRRRSLMRSLPPRLARWAAAGSFQLPLRSMTKTAFILAALQATIYFVQENVESVSAGLGWPGLSVLMASQHRTVLPLHLLAAACSAALLWAVSSWIRRSRRATQLAEMLVRLAQRSGDAPPRLDPVEEHVPNLRLTAGILGLRSPPLAV